MQTLTGIPASRGIAIGPAFVYQASQGVPARVETPDPQNELERFRQALRRAIADLERVYAEAVVSVGQETAEIFEAHRMMLEDPELIQNAEDTILNEHVVADFAMYQAAEVNAKMMESLEDAYFRARAADIRDVSRRVERILQGKSTDDANLTEPSIILAEDLAPSDTMQFKRSLILGFFTARGGTTSHTAILSKAMGIPAVVGAGQLPQNVHKTSVLIIDGDLGQLIVDPDEQTLALYRQRQAQQQDRDRQEISSAHQPAVTSDGRQVEVVANVGNLADSRDAMAKGAEGVGLLRTEFSYIEHNTVPDEEALVKIYTEILATFGDYPVVVRTLDIGGDKEMPHLQLPAEGNPFLGRRGIRLCFERPDLFIPQLRAILRAGVNTRLCIMFPMVAVVSEVRQAKGILAECMAALEKEGRAFNPNPQVGIMVEVPSAAVCADQLAREVDFFSIGTNDLTQYTLAVDRTNSSVAHLVSALQPAVMRLIRDVIRAGHDANIWVGMCGEMAGDATAIPILLGLGLDEFSMTPPLIPAAKQIIRQWDTAQARRLAEQALNCETPEQVKQLVAAWQH